jgi:hypothetical protein
MFRHIKTVLAFRKTVLTPANMQGLPGGRLYTTMFAGSFENQYRGAIKNVYSLTRN